MHATRAWTRTSLVSLATGLVLLAAGLVDARLRATDLAWFRAHGLVLVLGLVIPALSALHAWSLRTLAATDLPEAASRRAADLWLAGALLAASGALAPALWAVGAVGLALLATAGTIWSVLVMRHAPKHGLQDVARDPLTKGDDACLKHVHFAHRFLPLGLLALLAAALVGPVSGAWGARLHVAAVHLLVVGHGLLSVYGLSHLWVPRFSGVPAIAAGAIKGELHTTLLGLVGITAGFLAGLDTSVGRGLLVGLGPFVFLGFFVWMGVLGANIMRNKSPTNSVRPEFVYIPWVFSAVFWLVTSVLMGIFLNVLPESMVTVRPALRFAHLHVGLLGGVVQLLMGLGTRLLSGSRPPRFAGAMKGGFFLFNAGLAAVLYGRFQALDDPWLLGGTAAVVVSLALYAKGMAQFIRHPALAPA